MLNFGFRLSDVAQNLIDLPFLTGSEPSQSAVNYDNGRFAEFGTIGMTRAREALYLADRGSIELTRRIQQKLADAGKQKEDAAEAPAAPPATKPPPSLADTKPVAAIVQ